MYRYLINMAYIGTQFRGMQKQVCTKLLARRDTDDPFSIQGQVEMGLKQLKPLNVPEVTAASRTDAGVHALHNAVHVDLERRQGLLYKPTTVTISLNKYFTKNDVPIRILSTYLVPNAFNCRRNAILRTYLYRLCIIKSEKDYVAHLSHIPIGDLYRCTFVCTNSFDLAKFKEATSLFLGLHDFRSFMKNSSSFPDKITRRFIHRLDIAEINGASYGNLNCPFSKEIDLHDYRFYDITCSATGFLHNQVRRTVGALVAAAQGKVTTKDIKFMLEVPSKESWNPRIKTEPAHGLYLCKVDYPESDIQTFRAVLEK